MTAAGTPGGPLNILVDQGALALCAYLGLLGISLVRLWRKGGSSQAAIAGGGVLFYLIRAFFKISFCASSVYLWLALAVLNGRISELDQDTHRPPDLTGRRREDRPVRRRCGDRRGDAFQEKT